PSRNPEGGCLRVPHMGGQHSSATGEDLVRRPRTAPGVEVLSLVEAALGVGERLRETFRRELVALLEAIEFGPQTGSLPIGIYYGDLKPVRDGDRLGAHDHSSCPGTRSTATAESRGARSSGNGTFTVIVPSLRLIAEDQSSDRDRRLLVHRGQHVAVD